MRKGPFPSFTVRLRETLTAALRASWCPVGVAHKGLVIDLVGQVSERALKKVRMPVLVVIPFNLYDILVGQISLSPFYRYEN